MRSSKENEGIEKVDLDRLLGGKKKARLIHEIGLSLIGCGVMILVLVGIPVVKAAPQSGVLVFQPTQVAQKEDKDKKDKDKDVPEESKDQSGVLVVPSKPIYERVNLVLGGQDCNVNKAESAVLHLRGVSQVDIELRKGYLVVWYDYLRLSAQDMVEAVGEKKGKNWFCTATIER